MDVRDLNSWQSVTHRIEHNAHDGKKGEASAFHEELHRLRMHDTKDGTLDGHRYKNDIHAIEKKLRADGYLPQLDLFSTEAHKKNDEKSSYPDEAARRHGDKKLAPTEDHGDKTKTKELKGPDATDQGRDTGNPKIEPTGGKVYEWHGLDHKTGDHKSPDAMVLLPKNFDPNKPIHLVVYDHGWGDTAKSAYEKAHLAEQMANAPPNTVLIVPEWQKYAGSSGKAGGDQGKFSDEGFMAGMVQDIFKKTPELAGKTLDNVDHIGIISHSAGYHAAESQIYNNGAFSKKIDSVTLLDSLYDEHGFDKWLTDNIVDLGAGTKKFYNIFNSSTAAYSKEQEKFIENLLKQHKLSPQIAVTDYAHDGGQMTPEELSSHSIVFKSTSTAHMQIPVVYAGVVETAASNVDDDFNRDWL